MICMLRMLECAARDVVSARLCIALHTCADLHGHGEVFVAS